MFGYQKGEVFGKTLFDNILHGPVNADEVIRAVNEQARESREGFRNINKNRRKDGIVITCDWYNTPIFDEAGHPVEIISEALDISDQVRREDAKKILAPFIREKSGDMETCCGDFRGVLENLSRTLDSTRSVINRASEGTADLHKRFNDIDAILEDMDNVLGTTHVNSINLRIQSSRLSDKNFTEAFKVIGTQFNAANDKFKDLTRNLEIFYATIKQHLSDLQGNFDDLLASTASQREWIAMADDQYALLKSHLEEVHVKILEYLKI